MGRRYHAYRTTIVNGHRARVSPHLHRNPTDVEQQSPDILGPSGRAEWDRMHRLADEYYEGAWDMPEMTAWRSVKMKYPGGDGGWRPNKHHSALYTPQRDFVIPDPGEMIVLGRALEYAVLTMERGVPAVHVYRFPNDKTAPKLLWSDQRKMLMILPQDEISDELNPDLDGLDRSTNLYREWGWGQQPRGFVSHTVDRMTLPSIGMADTIVYRSGKGTDVRDDPPGVQEYIHQFGDGVVAYQGPSKNKPKAIVFTGGDIDVERAGIVN